MAYTRERLGKLLLTEGVIDAQTLDAALEEQRSAGGKLGEILVHSFGVADETIVETLADQKGLEHVSLGSLAIDREAVSLLPVRFARSERVVPVGFDDGSLVLVMADPLDIETMDAVRMMTGYRVKPVVASARDIAHAIERHMASADAVRQVVDEHEEEAAVAEVTAAATEDDVPVVRLVNQFIREAVLEAASDVHIEPEERYVRIRYRVDGVLRDVMRLPKNTHAGLVSRVKVMSDMDIAERRLPQDGRTTVIVDGRPVDLRIAALPGEHGESITIRILHESLAFRALEDLGMREATLAGLLKLLSKPYGAVLAAGPTGAGKTTTLYAALTRINEPTRKIVTIEDPVEYRLEGATQIAIRPKIGLSFAMGLRTILRADPDVVMIGEMRDPETAEIGIRAALTGHLVLSSIHTNDAPSALTRLVDMGVAPYITSSALLGVIAQRLARRLCEKCRRPVNLSGEDLTRAGFGDMTDSIDAFDAVGCERCSQTGYRGRIGLYELMSMSEELRRLYLAEAPSDQLRAMAVEQGMPTLREDALVKLRSGQTSLSEIVRVVV